MRRFVIALTLGLGLAVGCTQDFDTFSLGTGSGGTSGDASLSDGMAGGNGADVSAAGRDGGPDAPADAPADAPTDAPVCGLGTKLCGTSCVLDTKPAFGCAGAGCSPCSFPHATASCGTTGTCTIGTCDAGYADCNNDPVDGCETDLQSDTGNCGGCGTVCGEPNATAVCSAGKCGIKQCNSGYKDCNSDPIDGCETNTGTDPTACGSCTNDCNKNAGQWKCSNGSCQVNKCPPGRGDCNNNAADGCETNTNTSIQNCGSCTTVCHLVHATAKCDAGKCAIQSCNANYADCDGNPSNGCEVDLLTSASNCGACKRACSSSHTVSQSCTAGACTPTCSPGYYGDCSRPAAPAPDDGCETNLGQNPDNCGVCGHKCSTAHVASRTCSQGKCDPTCSAGWGNCTQPTAPAADNGCETNIASNSNDCGACGHACSFINVQATGCSAGLCTPTCTNGYGDCSTPVPPTPDDGCETSVSFDPDNCGACRRKCSTAHVFSRSCSLGQCDSLCQSSYGNCTQPTAPAADNGCETNTDTSADNCGNCGRACSSTGVKTRSCSGGTCNSTCVAGLGNCIQPASPANDDGCETVTTNNNLHCGSCANACGGLQSCINSTCASCPNGKADCDHNSTNGCETSVSANPFNCGGCGRACSTAQVTSLSCSGGTCDSTCQLGYANCTQPAAPTADDGCELAASSNDTDCGSCSNSCAAQGFVCNNNVCGCNSDSQCQSSGICKSGGVCECSINSFGGTITCKPGEKCHWTGTLGALRDCQCNGGSACGSGQVCCQSAGCTNLATDPANCGACGRSCPPGFTCNADSCECSDDASCNAGTAGTCAGGACKCGSTTCPKGERCLSDGKCG